MPGFASAWTPPPLARMDSLFIIAATGEPRFQASRDSCEKLLVAGGAATLDYLVAHRLTGQTPRQRHYVEKLFKAVSDSGKRREPVERLDAALRGAPDSVKVQLLRIGSELGDSAFLPVARLYLGADSLEVRKMAVRSLGTYPGAADRKFLLDGLENTRGLEKQERLWALSRHPPLREWPEILPALRDSSLHNRQLARHILVMAARGDWAILAARFPAAPLPAERLEWLLMAMEMPGPGARKFLARETARLDPDGRRFFQAASAPTRDGRRRP